MRSAPQVGREILAALEAMRPFLDLVPEQARLPVDLTGLGDAFGVAGPTAGTSADPAGHRGWPRPGRVAAGYQPLPDLLSATRDTAGEPLGMAPRGLTAGAP